MNGRRKLILGALALAAAPAPLLARGRPARIFMILFRGETAVEKGFRDYFSVNNIAVELIVRDVAMDVGKVPALILEARALKADLIYTWGTPVTLAVVGRQHDADKSARVTDIPVVFTMVASPEGSGLVDTRRGSGRNLTGACHVVPAGQQLSAMRAYRDFTRIAVIYNRAEPNSVQNVAELRAASRTDGFRLIEKPVPLDARGQPQAAALPALIASLRADDAQLLYLGPDTFVGANRKAITETALACRLPTFSATEPLLRDGKALFGLVSGYESMGHLTAYKAAQILQQHLAPGAIPIETLARFSYLVNMSVAAALDFYPPLKVINYAEVIR